MAKVAWLAVGGSALGIGIYFGLRESKPTQLSGSCENARIQKFLNQSDVTVFSTTYCRYCTQAERLLVHSQVNHQMIQMDKRADGADIASALSMVTGQQTVPNIFIGDRHIGGYTQLNSLIKDNPTEFENLLEKAQQRKEH